MKAILIPHRTYHFNVPQLSALKILKLILDCEIRHCIGSVSDDEQFLSLSVSVNLNKRYQRRAVIEIEEIIKAQEQ